MSVIVCTKGRAPQAAALVEALAQQTRHADEVIVVDGSPTDALRALLADKVPVRYLHRPEQGGLPEARNAGYAASTGDICVFLDDDIAPSADLLAQIEAAYLRDPSLAGVGGVPVEPRAPARSRLLFVRIFQRGPFAHPAALLATRGGTDPRPSHRLSGCAQSYRRDVLAKVPFDENLRGYALGEDMDHSWRASRLGPLVLLPQARVLHQGLGWTSAATSSRFERKVYAYAYHFLKNLRGDVRSRMAFVWLLAGIAGEATFHAVAQRSLDPLRGYARALRAVRRGLDGAGGFIARDPRRRS